ncbi:hypothetical protein PM082_014536 [Marasmius tenuissimus]|nr:hypothetical protein PM082_014536 [Marasmius tenuissimus]
MTAAGGNSSTSTDSSLQIKCCELKVKRYIPRLLSYSNSRVTFFLRCVDDAIEHTEKGALPQYSCILKGRRQADASKPFISFN